MSEQKQLRYSFNYIEKCNMCGADTANHNVLGRRLNTSQGKNPKKKIGISTTIVKCTDCGLIYSNPQPIPYDIQDHYGVTPENYWKPSYFVINENSFKGEIWRLQQLMPFKAEQKSLDIGAGIGHNMLAMIRAGYDAYGFEPGNEFYKRAIDRMKISADKLKLGSIEAMNYPENAFDFVSFGAVLEHLYNPSTAIEKAMKWLKPNGIMHIEVPSSDWLMNKLINLSYKVRGMDYVGNLSPMHEPYHLHEFSLNTFIANGKRLNYDIAFYQYYVGDTLVPKIVQPVFRKYMSKTNKGMQLCVWLKRK